MMSQPDDRMTEAEFKVFLGSIIQKAMSRDPQVRKKVKRIIKKNEKRVAEKSNLN